MNILKRLLEFMGPSEALPLRDPGPVPERAGAIRSSIGRLLETDGADVHSSVEGSCLYYSSKLLDVLNPEYPDLQLWSVFGSNAPIIHYHLRTPDGLIIDPTWQQLLSGDIPPNLERVLIGTRNELVERLKPLADILPYMLHTGRGSRLSPRDFVDLYYGFGLHAEAAKDKTQLLRGVHKNPRTEAFRRHGSDATS